VRALKNLPKIAAAIPVVSGLKNILIDY